MNKPKSHPESRARIIATFYVVLGLAGVMWHAVAQENNDVWNASADPTWRDLVLGPVVGVVFGVGVVALFRALETRMAWLPELHREFRAMFGRPSMPEVVLLAAASAVGEELFFRGAMLDAWGLWTSSLVFALLHVPPRRSLWPWTASAGVLGCALAALTMWTENLGAAVAAHFTINLLNLAYVTRRSPGLTVGGPVRPA
jgi:membrane protease YdiL (CAAX protease family)